MSEKLVIFTVLAMVMDLFGSGVVWGQHISNPGSSLGVGPWQSTSPNQSAYQDQFYNGLTNLTRDELYAINRYRDLQRGDMGGSHLSPSLLGKPDNYNQMTEDQKDILDVLYRAADDVHRLTDDNINYLNAQKAALLQRKPYLTRGEK